ncbi:MAG: cytochrome c3 family protein [Bacillota bacterium]
MHPKYSGWLCTVIILALMMIMGLGISNPVWADEGLASSGQNVNTTCLACHTNIDAVKYGQSVHGKQACLNCHPERETIPHQAQKLNRLEMKVHTCLKCHKGEIEESYRESFHGRAVFAGSTKAPTCVSCHTNHYIAGPDNPVSSVSKNNTPMTCSKCHDQAPANLAEGKEHFVLAAQGPGKPMYYTYKFFTWLTIITVTLLLIHVELELYRQLREN